MTQQPDPAEVFLELLNGVAAGKGEELALLYAEDTRVIHPLDPMRSPALRTRDELAKHFKEPLDGSGPQIRLQPTNVVIHQTLDPEVIITEFEYIATIAKTNATVALPCIFVMRVRDGKIVSSRDYTDHLGLAIALGDVDWLNRAAKSAAYQA